MIVPKYSATLDLPQETSVALNANHINMVKYSTAKANDFIRVMTHLRRLVENASNLPKMKGMSENM